MCDHEEILECGEYVCIKCGLVLAQEYIYEDRLYEEPLDEIKRLDLYSNICNILANLNLNSVCQAKKVYELIDKYLSDFKCNIELKIGASIYYTLTLQGVAYQLNRISGLICSNITDTKKLFKLIQVFPQQNILSNDISKLAEPLMNFTSFENSDKNNILRLISNFSCKYCSYSPITQIAGISYWYFKTHMKTKKSLKSICDSLLISQNSVHLYMNHACVNKWNLK